MPTRTLIRKPRKNGSLELKQNAGDARHGVGQLSKLAGQDRVRPGLLVEQLHLLHEQPPQFIVHVLTSFKKQYGVKK